MDFKILKQYIKELMGAMERSQIKRLCFKHQELEVEIERQENLAADKIESHDGFSSPPYQNKDSTVKTAAWQRAPSSPYPAKEQLHLHEALSEEEEGVTISSPMVGTFYSTPAPDQPPFVAVGRKVVEGEVVCIIEAMKVMNEIKANVSGTIAEVLVEDGDPVEYGTKLFRIT